MDSVTEFWVLIAALIVAGIAWMGVSMKVIRRIMGRRK